MEKDSGKKDKINLGNLQILIRVNMLMIRKVDTENSNGQVGTAIKGNIKMMKEMVKVKCHGLTEVST